MSAATDAAVSASISTPVVCTASARATTAAPALVERTSTATCDRGMGWQSGMSSQVRLAAWMPARRAAARTSPFFAVPLFMALRAAADIATWASAMATRRVAGLAPTSTMRAWPRASRWLSLGGLMARILAKAGAADNLGGRENFRRKLGHSLRRRR